MLACVLVTNGGYQGSVDISDEDRDAILAELRHAADTLDTAVEDLRETLDSQRARLGIQIQATAAVTIASLCAGLEQLGRAVEIIHVQATNLRETVTASARAALASVTSLALEDGGSLLRGLHDRVAQWSSSLGA